jgi:hypothetical protein
MEGYLKRAGGPAGSAPAAAQALIETDEEAFAETAWAWRWIICSMKL